MKVVKLPDNKFHVCDSCEYDHENTKYGNYQIQFNSGDRINMCKNCLDELNKILYFDGNIYGTS